MLATFEQLLHDIRSQGLRKIEPRLDLDHMPTIGSMYEGLTKELITRSLFESFDLHVRSGQIQNANGTYSPQLDCMLVIGEGEKLPYSDNYIYQPTNVVAVFEVKKTLNQSEIEDALAKFAKVTDLALDEFGKIRERLKLGPASRIHKDAFQAICRMAFPHGAADKELAGVSRDVFQFLLAEAYLPLRIILSFGGYTTEDGLRQGYISAFRKTNNLLATPNLVICNDLTVVKANGMPFAPERRVEAGWDVYYSQPKLAIRNLLNILWYRISRIYARDFLWLTDGRVYTHNVLMSFRRTANNEVHVDEYSTIPRRELGKAEEINPEPHLISIEEFVLLGELMSRESISIADETAFLATLDEAIKKTILAAVDFGCPVRHLAWDTMGDLLNHVKRNGFIARQGETLVLTTSRCVLVMSREGMFAGENRDGRFTRRFGGQGLFSPDSARSTVAMGSSCDSDSEPLDRQGWLALPPKKHSPLVQALCEWINRAAQNGLRERTRIPSIDVVTVQCDEFQICALRTDDGKYQLRISDSVELLLRDVIFRWLALPTTCREVGDPSLEAEGLLLGQFNRSLFQLQHDVFPYEMRIPQCAARQRYANELLTVSMQFLIAHSMSHVLLGHVDYISKTSPESIIDEFDTLLPAEEAKDRRAMEWSADVTAVSHVCANRLGRYEKDGSAKLVPKATRRSKGSGEVPRVFDEMILLIERAIGIVTLYSERAWFYTKEDNRRSHQDPQWRFIASLDAIDMFLRNHFSRGRDSLSIPRERAIQDIVEARKGLVWARLDAGIAARFMDVEQKTGCQQWQARTRALVDPYAYMQLPTFI